MQQFEEACKQLEGSLSNAQNVSALSLSVSLVVGGFRALYIRMLDRRCSATASDADSFTRVFPLMILVATAVSFVVKSSIALSLGLVGALSIVRFRAAISRQSSHILMRPQLFQTQSA